MEDDAQNEDRERAPETDADAASAAPETAPDQQQSLSDVEQPVETAAPGDAAPVDDPSGGAEADPAGDAPDGTDAATQAGASGADDDDEGAAVDDVVEGAANDAGDTDEKTDAAEVEEASTSAAATDEDDEIVVLELPDAEPALVIPESTPNDEPVTVSPELEAEVEEALEGVELPADEDAEPAEPFVDDRGDWFVIHTYSGYENKVKANLETRIVSMNMEEKIYEVVVPTEDVVEVKGGKKQTVQRKVLPGYVLVRMDLDDDSWYVVRNTPNVTGFVGSGNHPIPLSEREVDRLLRRKEEAERPKPRAEWQVNDGVRVTTGPFANFQGVISDVDGERQKVKVLVNIFGRETPVELSFDQISKV